jgi:hypothetical protein
MSDDIRGSDKLKTSCSTLSTLTPEELEAVAGGYSLSNGFYYVFPRGIPWPELFKQDSMSPIEGPIAGPMGF